MTRLKNPELVAFNTIVRRFELASYNMGGRFSPAISRRDDGTYYIRVLGGHSFGSNGNSWTNWEYSELDKSGMIVESPRGLAKEFTGRVRLSGLDEAVREYAEKRINQF